MTDKELFLTVKDISKKAKHLTLKGKFKTSIEEYKKGVALLGEPVMESKYAVMLFSGIGEAYFLQKKWEEALEYYGYAVKSKGGLGEPLIHLRLGQLRYELGDMEKAKDELIRAYMGAGDIIFEAEYPKYFNLIRDIINKQK